MNSEGQFIKSQEKVFTVSEFIDTINEILFTEKVIIRGEIGEKISQYPSYSFFYLLDKNENAILKCFIWQKLLNISGVELKSGSEVIIEGFPEIFKKRGDFTFQVEKIGLVGEGALKRAFEVLKQKLAQAGYFGPSRKKPIPKFCQKIGLITSQYGKGALPDFQKHLGEYGFKVYFYDVRVEGLSAVDDIVEAIRWFNESKLDIDVLVLIRGGGSWESLQPFNSEIVAKTIFSSKIPIICGIGHETDETIADYVADLRVSTPAVAARALSDPWELAKFQITGFKKNITSSVSRVYRNVSEQINFFENAFHLVINRKIKLEKRRLDSLITNLNFVFQVYFKKFDKLESEFFNNSQIIKTLIKEMELKIRQLLINLNKDSSNWIENVKSLLLKETEKLNLVSPALRLKQGYSITCDALSGKIIRSISQVKVGKDLKTKLYKGIISSKVEKVFKR